MSPELAKVGKIEHNAKLVPFCLGTRGEFSLPIPVEEGDIVIVYLFEGQQVVSYDVYVARKRAAGESFLWTSVRHYELGEHEKKTLNSLILPGGVCDGVENH